MRLALEAIERLKKKAAKVGVPYAQYVRRQRGQR
jgi:predicted DNA binding CopG/RHH family protein